MLGISAISSTGTSATTANTSHWNRHRERNSILRSRAALPTTTTAPLENGRRKCGPPARPAARPRPSAPPEA